MNKLEVIGQISRQVNMPKESVGKVIDAFIGTVKQAVYEGDRVILLGFGSFESRERKERKARVPQTGEMIQVPAKIVPGFNPHKEFRNLLMDNQSPNLLAKASSLASKSSSLAASKSEGLPEKLPLLELLPDESPSELPSEPSVTEEIKPSTPKAASKGKSPRSPRSSKALTKEGLVSLSEAAPPEPSPEPIPEPIPEPSPAKSSSRASGRGKPPAKAGRRKK